MHYKNIHIQKNTDAIHYMIKITAERLVRFSCYETIFQIPYYLDVQHTYALRINMNQSKRDTLESVFEKAMMEWSGNFKC